MNILSALKSEGRAFSIDLALQLIHHVRVGLTCYMNGATVCEKNTSDERRASFTNALA
jgi:hypothetical protein